MSASSGKPPHSDLTIRIEDVAAKAREVFGEDAYRKLLPPGADVLEHDYRFTFVTPQGGHVTMNRRATADEIVQYLESDHG